jgi:formate-dependent nitrite reductase cytochrome c552 subunit
MPPPYAGLQQVSAQPLYQGLAIGCLLLALGGACGCRPVPPPSPIESESLALAALAAVEGGSHPVTIRQFPATPMVDTGLTDSRGEPVYASCVSCHATTTPNLETRSGDQLVEFHQGLHFEHGDLSCLSCHNAADYDTLRLADGTAVTFPDTMTLCAQCHGRQARDYERGLHGGMTGYWDLTRGPRARLHCVHCHDPHAPKFPLVQPVFPPRDRVAVPRDAARSD